MRLPLLLVAFLALANGLPKKGHHKKFHHEYHSSMGRQGHRHADTSAPRIKRSPNFDRSYENTTSYWLYQAQSVLNEKLHLKHNTNVAKNVIFFLGDGMSIATLAAARAYLGQRNGNPGEETVLSFEEFPYTGLSKTYCVDSQVADSACSATAYLCGVKGSIATIGYNGNIREADWSAGLNESNKVSSIARWSQRAGKKTGFVTTTRVTHASPAGLYASIADRDWESDYDVESRTNCTVAELITDIAKQLIRGETGRNFDVIMGGGRVKFLPDNVTDEEGQKGERIDNVNLIDEWISNNKDRRSKYVWHRKDLLALNRNTEKVLGLFESDHTKFNLDREEADPSLKEMTEAAIKVLQKSKEGFFLFVEGGRIDHGHHETRAVKALDETVEFAEAIRRARKLTNREDTLIVVTSDHAHTMTLSGYADRGSPIFGDLGLADDNIPYLTLTYANGPGYRPPKNDKRYDISNDETDNKDYQFPTLAPLKDETHGGDDVGIYADGPWAHLFVGVLEQNVIPHLVAYASCVGDGITVCDDLKES